MWMVPTPGGGQLLLTYAMQGAVGAPAGLDVGNPVGAAVTRVLELVPDATEIADMLAAAPPS